VTRATGRRRGEKPDRLGRRLKTRRYPKGAIPPGVEVAVAADCLTSDAAPSHQELAAQYGVSPREVDRIASIITGLDLETVARLKGGSADLLAVLAAKHTLQALKTAENDPGSSVKSTFGAKLATEARRLYLPEGEGRPGGIVAFIGSLDARSVNVTLPAPEPPPSEAAPPPELP